MEIEGQIIITQPLVLTGIVVVSGSGGGGGGTSNYNELSNKPSINGTTLSGNKTSHQLGVADEIHTHTVSQITDFPTLAAVATSGSYSDLTGTPTIPTNTSDLNNDSGYITINDVPAQQQSDWNEADITSPAYIENKPTIPAAQVNADWNAVSGVEQILNKPTIPDAVSGVNDGTNWTSITIGNETKGIPSGGGGLTDYDFTHVANTTVSSSTTITFAANTRGSQMVSTSADLAVTFAVNNGSDNYLWIKNTSAADIDVTISAVTYNGNAVANVYVPTDGITIPAGSTGEIGIICNADGAFITAFTDLSI